MNSSLSVWALSLKGVLWVSLGLTGVALLENTIAPWAPFYAVYALLAIVLPFALRASTFGRARAIRLRTWVLAIVSGIVLQALASLFIGYLYPRLLGALGTDPTVLDQPFYSLGPALAALFDAAALRLDATAGTVQIVYLGFITIWAGFGEEVFYRGYLHGTLARYRGFAFAAIVSASFFAVRHATQLALLWPEYPWAAAAAWVVLSFLVGIYMSFLYHRTRSLYLPITVHYIFNLIPFVSTLLSPAAP
jgi:membrane protease YdiL (CAAX protease family)